MMKRLFLHIFPLMKIKELDIDERPMEKLHIKGPQALSNTELIGILLKTGTASLNAMDIARMLLSHSEGSLTRLSDMSLERITMIPGIGKMKAATISAALELGRRFMGEKGFDKCTITGPTRIFYIMIPLLKGLSHEEFWVLFLNRANYIIGKEQLSSGGISSTTIDNKMVVIRAMEKKANSVIMIHNHPSGNPRPGQADIQQTEKLKKALEAMDIILMDHIIVCDDCYFSFAEEKVFNMD